jgi:MFS family permease
VAAACSAQRLLPPGTLALRQGLPAVFALRGLAAAAFFGAEAFVPLMMTTERGLSPALAGSALTAGALGWAAGSWYEVRQASPSARNRALRRGMMAMVVGIAAQPLVLIPGTPLYTSIIGWGVAGLGMGIMYPILSTLTLELSPVEAQGANSATPPMLTSAIPPMTPTMTAPRTGPKRDCGNKVATTSARAAATAPQASTQQTQSRVPET